MEQHKKEWYNPQKMLSYNQFLNFVIGGRDIGKTFAMKKYLLQQFVKNGKQSLYLRRNKTELDGIDKESFFPRIMLEQIFPNYEEVEVNVSRTQTKIVFTSTLKDFENGEFIITSGKIMLNGRVVIYLKSLSTWVNLKGSEYDNVFFIMFDEVLIDTSSNKRYLKNEVEAFLNLLISVFRQRKNCHVYLLSNAANINNPYFAYFKFYENTDRRFYNLKDRRILIEFPPNQPFDGSSDDDIYHLIKDSKIYDSVANNKFQVDRGKNIGKLKGDKTYLYSLYIDGITLSCYSCNGLVYVKVGYDKHRNIYSVDPAESENGLIYMDRSSDLAWTLRQCYLKNCIWYENAEAKNYMLSLISKIL